ncbi:hypothetical protein DOY81_013039, partial [Sarcophaga bullata]
MSDRRKDMWKLLYSLVNRNETQLDDVFESTNRFQDTFILWLVNKLVKSLKVEIGQDYETHEKNLKIQRKLLNSCLVNRSVLFEILIHGYVAAIDELCEEYAKADLTPQVENEDQLLKITAFTSDDDCLKEIDPDFSFPAIEVGIDDVDEYIRALLQILHHGLFVGYTHYSMVFENSLLTVLKVLKECEFLTKLNCLQYLGRVFEKVSSLNCHLQNMYDLTFRALTLMWNYMPMWLNNNCFPLEAFDDFIEESINLLKILKHLQNQASYKEKNLKAVEKHIFIANQDNLMLKFSFHLPLFVVKEWLTMEFILKEFHLPSLKNPVVYKNLLKLFCCYNNESTEIVQIKKFIFNENICNTSCQEMLQVEAVCRKCFNSLRNNSDLDLKQYLEINLAVLQVTKINSMSSANRKLPPQLKSKFIEELFTNQDFHNITNHLDYSQLTAEEALNFIFSSSMDITKLYLPTVSAVVAIFLQNDSEFVHKLSAAVLQKVVESLKPNEMVEHQKTILEIIDCCTQHNGLLTEHWLFHFFKMTFFYLLHPESQVTHEAILTACEMCSANNVQPIQLWNWYKRDALNLVVKLIVYVYLSRGVRMTRSLKAFTKMLGFSCVQEFICKYYRLLVTMILPYCVKEPLCKGLIVSISKITRKPVSSLFVVSFLRIYTHIYLTEDAEIGNACIEFIGKCTGASLSKLMNTDVKQTVSEFLVYFNRSPTFVMQAFQCLLPNEVGATTSAVRKTTKNSSQEFANFINDRFLGVITYFQTCLAEPNFEKPLKEETLC